MVGVSMDGEMNSCKDLSNGLVTEGAWEPPCALVHMLTGNTDSHLFLLSLESGKVVFPLGLTGR